MLIHVNIPRGHYIGQVRQYGARRWNTVTSRCRSAANAMSLAVKRMGQDDHRARALFIDNSGWYEPHQVLEAKK